MLLHVILINITSIQEVTPINPFILTENEKLQTNHFWKSYQLEQAVLTDLEDFLIQ